MNLWMCLLSTKKKKEKQKDDDDDENEVEKRRDNAKKSDEYFIELDLLMNEWMYEQYSPYAR